MMDGFFGMGFSWIVWLIIIVAIVWAIFRFKGNNHGQYRKDNESSLDILKKRYANGEISKDEFERMKKDLM